MRYQARITRDIGAITADNGKITGMERELS